MSGRKSANRFFVTFPQRNDWVKQDVIDIFLPICSSLLVCRESHTDGGQHFHAVLQTTEPYFTVQVIDYCHIYLPPGGALDVQVPKAIVHCVHYLFKEDPEPFCFGDDFKKYYPYAKTALDFVKSDPEYSLLKPFVMNHWTSYKFLDAAHQEYWQRNAVPLSCVDALRPVRQQDPWYTVNEMDFRVMGWTSSVLRWAAYAFVAERTHKMRQLYLYGPPNTGKTTLASAGVDFDRAFFAGRDKWWMEGWNSAIHSFIVIDEFDWDHFTCKKELLKLLAGETYVGNIKGKSPIRFKLNIPVIMITNEDPPEDAAFNVRVEIVYADACCYE